MFLRSGVEHQKHSTSDDAPPGGRPSLSPSPPPPSPTQREAHVKEMRAYLERERKVSFASESELTRVWYYTPLEPIDGPHGHDDNTDTLPLPLSLGAAEGGRLPPPEGLPSGGGTPPGEDCGGVFLIEIDHPEIV